MGPNSLLLVSVAFLLLATGTSRPLQAATQVAQAIQIGVANGGPTATITLSGCNVSPGTITSGGSAQTVMADPSCPISATLPGGANSRYQSASGASSLTINTCAAPGPCATYSATLYYQLQNTYGVVANAQSTFDSGLTFTITGTLLGASGSVLCTISPSSTDSLKSCTLFADYGTTVNFPASATGASTNTRWASKPPTSFTQTTGGNTNLVNYYKQLAKQFAYSVSGGGSGFSAPALTCTQLGSSSSCATLTLSLASYWLDFGSFWSATDPLSGSASSERWSSNSASGMAASVTSFTVTYYHQFLVLAGYVVVDGGNPPSQPSISYRSYGTMTSAALALTPAPYWMDTSSASVTPTLFGVTGERWRTPTESYTVTGPTAISVRYYHQYQLTFSYAILGGGTGYIAPVLSRAYLGSTNSSAIGQTSSQYWTDAGGTWSLTGTLVGSSLQERWATNQPSSGTALSATTSAVAYYHQFMTTFVYGIVGGGSGYSPPSIIFRQFGSPVNGTNGWADSGSTYMYSNPLPRSSFTERWFSGAPAGPVSSSSPVEVTYYHQYAYLLNYTVVGGGKAYRDPSLNYTTTGSNSSGHLSSAQETYWLDSGTSWAVVGQLPGSSPTERWTTNQPTSGSAASSVLTAFTYYHQYLVSVAYSIFGGGSPVPPAFAYQTHGLAEKTTLSIQTQSFWVDSASHWSLPYLLMGSGPAERWVANFSTAMTVSSQFSTTLQYLHQYHVIVSANSLTGGTFSNSTHWYDSGVSLRLNAVASDGWKFAYWEGMGSGSYNGTEPSPTFAVEGPYKETAIFYPGLTISTDSNGYVSYAFGSTRGNVTAGSTKVLYVPPGVNVSLKANPGIFDVVFTGWSGGLSGTDGRTTIVVGAPILVIAGFGLDYTDITVIAMTIPIAIISAFYILAIRRWPRKNN